MTANVLASGARLVVQSGSPFFAPRSFWTIDATLRSAGLHTTPFHVDVPSFGDWGFVLAAMNEPPTPTLRSPTPLRSLDETTLTAATVFPPDRRPKDPQVSTLMHPVILDLQRQEWR